MLHTCHPGKPKEAHPGSRWDSGQARMTGNA